MSNCTQKCMNEPRSRTIKNCGMANITTMIPVQSIPPPLSLSLSASLSSSPSSSPRLLTSLCCYLLFFFSSHHDSIMADQMAGEWYARACGLPPIVPPSNAQSALKTIFEYPFDSFVLFCFIYLIYIYIFDEMKKQCEEVWHGRAGSGERDETERYRRHHVHAVSRGVDWHHLCRLHSCLSHLLSHLPSFPSSLPLLLLKPTQPREARIPWTRRTPPLCLFPSALSPLLSLLSLLFLFLVPFLTLFFSLSSFLLLVAAAMLQEGLEKEAFETARGVIHSTYERFGYQFQTPEAWDINGGYRSTAYMRPLAISFHVSPSPSLLHPSPLFDVNEIWAIQWAWENLHKQEG